MLPNSLMPRSTIGDVVGDGVPGEGRAGGAALALSGDCAAFAHGAGCSTLCAGGEAFALLSVEESLQLLLPPLILS